jgi:hypothetical protein
MSTSWYRLPRRADSRNPSPRITPDKREVGSSTLSRASFINLENGEGCVHRYQLRFNAFAVALALTNASTSHAQGFPFSQRGSVGQTVAFTDITITYGRGNSSATKV